MSKIFFGQVDTLQQDVDGFHESTTNQGIDINPLKCQIIQFCHKRYPCSSPPSIVLQSHPLTTENSFKILGAWFASNSASGLCFLKMLKGILFYQAPPQERNPRNISYTRFGTLWCFLT
jgi:hypothetical protein